MDSTLIAEQKEEREKNKSGAATGDVGRVKQLYDKTKAVKDKYDKAKSGYNNASRAKNKVQQEYKWFKNGEVHPTYSAAAQQLTTQAAANMAPQSATVLQASRITAKMAVLAVVATVAVVVPLSVGITYGLSKCQPYHQQTTSTITSHTSDEEKGNCSL